MHLRRDHYKHPVDACNSAARPADFRDLIGKGHLRTKLGLPGPLHGIIKGFLETSAFGSPLEFWHLVSLPILFIDEDRGQLQGLLAGLTLPCREQAAIFVRPIVLRATAEELLKLRAMR